MPILKDSYSLYIREMQIFTKNWKTSIIRSLIFPIVLILLLGNLGSTPKNIPVAVVNYDNSPASLQFINALQAGNLLLIAASTDQNTAMGMLSQGQITSVIVIPAGFDKPGRGSANIVAYTDTSVPISAQAADSAIQSAASSFGVTVTNKIAPQQSSGLSVSTNYAFGASASYKTFLIAGLLVMVTAFGSIWSGGFTMLTDKQLGSMKAFLATPINKSSILISKIMYGVTSSMINAVLALGIGMLAGATIAGGIGGFIVILWFLLLSAVGFGGLATMLGARAGKIEVYTTVGMAVTMPLWILSGAFLPISTLPSFMIPFATFNPMTYGVNAVRDIMLKGYITLGAFAFDSAILIAFSVIMLALSNMLFKNANNV
ncbi:MAG: ABC transporter permease [Candidatus Micrarchaeota archaeon]|nr:ABC transporter permease [Candidatus Micrarchaeota archaeon]